MIFGSTAIKFWFPDFNREPKDLDLMTQGKSSREIEHLYIPEFEYIFENNSNPDYCDPNFLYTIKVSHLAWELKNNSWDKHMHDAIFLKEKGCTLDKELFISLYNRWSLMHGKKHVKMNVDNSDFFKETIYRRYNHEELHEHFAFYSRPLNEKIRKDIKSPLCSEELWNNLTFDDKLKCTLEEIFVLTSERFIFIDKPLPIKFARVKTLKHMIASTTSGWFNLFLIQNFKELISLEQEYFETKLKGIK